MSHKIFRCLAGILASSLASAGYSAVWEPKPGDAGQVLPERVRIVKQGIEHQRTQDGNVHGIVSHHRYRIERDPTTGLWRKYVARHDIQQFHDFDVDGNGKANDDTVACHPFSMENPLTPVAPFYDTTIGSQRFFGGAAIFQANIGSTGFSEDGMNDGEEGPPYQPRRNWTFFHETYEIFSPYRLYLVCAWKKADFMNGGSQYRVSFDAQSELSFLVMRYYMGIDGFRFVVWNGDRFYISEKVYQYAGDPPGDSGGKAHVIRPAAEKWAEYFPREPYHIQFNPQTAQYTHRSFDDITAVGWYMFKDELVAGYVGHKWYAFEADAVVHRPARPSENIAMTEIKGQGTPPFYLSTCEVPYQLWRKTHKYGRSNTFTRDPRGANFDQRGDMGSMDFPDAKGVYLTHGQEEPVTDVTYYDVLAWCNQLSVMESKMPCYYEDPACTVMFREVKQSPMYLKPRALPTLYVKWSANGYRLPTSAEWVAALDDRQAANRSATTGISTTPVGSGKPNSQGIYNQMDNVWELVWTHGNALDPIQWDKFVALGGAFYAGKPMQVSASPYGDNPFGGRFDIGFRLVRREANLPAPSAELGTLDPGIPIWQIHKKERTTPVPARQLKAPLHKELYAQQNIPNSTVALGIQEVSFAQWKEVCNWAMANGYTFNYDGEMGSMAYWGFGKDWQPGSHGPDEPVTGITSYDMMIWLNALSELEGKTPVYYQDAKFSQPVRQAFEYQPLQLLLGEGNKLVNGGILNRDRFAASAEYFIKGDADGYRLPDFIEFQQAMLAGAKTKYPYGEEPQSALAHAWTADASNFRTHGVKTKKPNAWGFFDMVGNVSEICHNRKGGFKTDSQNGYLVRVAGSFMDILDDLFAENAIKAPTATGLAYPDVGFRIARYNAVEKKTATSRFQNWAEQVVASMPSLALPSLVSSAQAAEATTQRATKRKAVGPMEARVPSVFHELQGQVHRANLRRDGVHQTTGLPEFHSVKWKFQTGGPVRSSPVTVGGVVYVGSHDGYFYALDAVTGALKWKCKTQGRIAGSAAVVADAVYFAGEDGYVYALRASDGSVIWKTYLKASMAGSPAVLNGIVYIGGGVMQGSSEKVTMSAKPIFGLDVATGREVWQSKSSGPQGYAAIATDGLRLYAGLNGSTYAAFDIQTGEKEWDVKGGHQNRQFMSMTYVVGQIFIPTTMRGAVMAVSMDGKTQWFNSMREGQLDMELNLGGKFGYECFTDVAVAHGLVYAGNNDGKLYAFRVTDGSKAWNFLTGDKVQSSPSLAGKTVYFGGWDGFLYALEASEGRLRWKTKLGGRIISSPWPGDGVLFVGCDDGVVYALH
jgi:outer membrane protein assembly factor BamB/formylglycine-generating enzyme required for sulfatase activity